MISQSGRRLRRLLGIAGLRMPLANINAYRAECLRKLCAVVTPPSGRWIASADEDGLHDPEDWQPLVLPPDSMGAELHEEEPRW